MQRFATYVRANDRAALTSQQEGLISFGESHGWKHVKTFADAGPPREGMERLMSALTDGEFEILVISDPSRLGRDSLSAVDFVSRLVHSGVRLFSADGKGEISLEDTSRIAKLLGIASASPARYRVTGEAGERAFELLKELLGNAVEGYLTGTYGVTVRYERGQPVEVRTTSQTLHPMPRDTEANEQLQSLDRLDGIVKELSDAASRS